MADVEDALDDLELELHRQDEKVKALLAAGNDTTDDASTLMQQPTPKNEQFNDVVGRIKELEGLNQQKDARIMDIVRENGDLRELIQRLEAENQHLKQELSDCGPQSRSRETVDMCKVMMMVREIEAKQCRRANEEHERAYDELNKLCSETRASAMALPCIDECPPQIPIPMPQYPASCGPCSPKWPTAPRGIPY